MPRSPLPPVAVVVSFVDCINRGDLDGLTALMHEEHRLDVLDEAPVVGRDATAEAWRGYFNAFPEYVIHPWYLRADGARVAVLGATTGSHLGLPDDEELRIGVIWIGDTVGGALTRWAVRADEPSVRRELGIPDEV